MKTLTLEVAKKMMEENHGNLDLHDSDITSLPDGLTVGGSLYLNGCAGLTSLPNGLTVGGRLYRNGTNIPVSAAKKIKHLHDGDYVEGQHLFADGILTHIKTVRKLGKYTLFVGKIPGRNVVYDGAHYAHCSNLRKGIADLLFKAVEDRGADQYKGLALDTEVSIDEAKTMYRVITGACWQGTENFVKSLKAPKAKYTIREMIDLTKGQYNAEKFEQFFS